MKLAYYKRQNVLCSIFTRKDQMFSHLQTMIKKNNIEYQWEFETNFYTNDLKTFQIKIITLNVRGLKWDH